MLTPLARSGSATTQAEGIEEGAPAIAPSTQPLSEVGSRSSSRDSASPSIRHDAALSESAAHAIKGKRAPAAHFDRCWLFCYFFSIFSSRAIDKGGQGRQ
jgi:hypothetical protein